MHFFRNLIARLKAEGHQVRVTGRDKDILVELARDYGLEVEVFGVARKGVLNLAAEMIGRQRRLRHIIKEFRPDVMMAIAGTYISSLGKLMGVPTYVFYDTEHATISNLLSFPFATCVYVPSCYRKQIRWRHVRYEGYHELAYLHPKYFQADPSVLDEAGVKPGELFSIVRFVGWAAGHDVGLKGLTTADKVEAVKALARHGKVFVSSEGALPAELEQYRLKLPVSRIHHFMAHAALIFGESPTMAAEGAVLGVPSICIHPIVAGTTAEQEQRYAIVFSFPPERMKDAVAKAESILTGHHREEWQAKAKRIVDEKVDVTEMMYQILSRRAAQAA